MGARQIDIRNQFVMEAFVVTVTGGLLGIAMGLAIAKGPAPVILRSSVRVGRRGICNGARWTGGPSCSRRALSLDGCVQYVGNGTARYPAEGDLVPSPDDM